MSDNYTQLRKFKKNKLKSEHIFEKSALILRKTLVLRNVYKD